MPKYMDSGGLSHLMTKIKSWANGLFATKASVNDAVGDQIRVSDKAYTGGGSTVIYRKLAVLPIDNSGNGSSIIISGRCGGWVQSNFGYIEVLLTNRTSAYSGDTITSATSSSGASGMYGFCDIVAYAQTNKSAIVYLKLTSYYAYDLVMQTCSGVTVSYSTDSITPTGTLIWSLKESPQTKLDATGTLTASKFKGPIEGNVTGDVTGGIHDATVRPASANRGATASSLLRHYLATSSMTAGKPMADGHIIDMDWDNNGGWASQLFVPNESNEGAKHVQWRGQAGGSWNSWMTVFDDTSVIPIANGGTGATTAAAAWTALGGGAIGKKASLAATDIPAHASTATTYGAASTSNYGHVKLSSATNSSSEDLAATPKAVKAAYDLANSANGTANSALGAATGALIFDWNYSIASNGTITCTPHVYQAGSEVTTNYASTCFVWSYRLGGATPSYVTLTTNSDRSATVPISSLGFGGYVKCDFTPPS